MKQTRLDALSDGIFAIVMTILVFEIRIPYFSGSLADKQIFDLLISILPLLINYILSFSLLFTYWRSNHFIASVLAKNIDVNFSNLNGLFLFLVALIPFFSNFLGNYPNSKVTVIAFAVNVILIGLVLFVMRRYAIKSKNIENTPFTEIENSHAYVHILFPVFSAVVAIIISFFSTTTAIFVLTLAILFNLSKNGTRYLFGFLDLFRKNKIENLNP